MNKIRKIVYVKLTPERNEIVYTGITFAEFFKYLRQPIENLMTIMGDTFVFGLKYERIFELFEGQELVKELTEADVYNLGNFCFVDYVSPGRTEELTEGQMAELLYLGNMFKPLESPFFEVLQNRFAYVSHDDGWYCKLFCRNIEEFVSVLCGKIIANVDSALCKTMDSIGKELLLLATEGILIDLDELSCKKGNIDGEVYVIGEIFDIDATLNNLRETKENASRVCILHGDGNGWNIT